MPLTYAPVPILENDVLREREMALMVVLSLRVQHGRKELLEALQRRFFLIV